MSPQHLAAASEVIQYQFKNDALLCESLTHSSVADNRLMSNERMEFLGDAVLELVVCHAIYERFPTYPEGELTKIKSAVVSRRTCAEISREQGFDRLLHMGKGLHSRQAIPSSLAAAVYESLVAAIYIDGGFEPAREFVMRTMLPKVIAISNTLHQHNYKASLQQYAQRAMGAMPQYELLDEKGPDHSKCFEIGVRIAGRRFGSAWGMNKKVAEQKAALHALGELGQATAEEVEEGLDAISSSEPAFAE